MPRVITCSGCGKQVHRGPGSRPEVTCRECRKKQPRPYGPRDGVAYRGRYEPGVVVAPWLGSVCICTVCGERFQQRIEGRGNRKAYCSERCRNRRPRRPKSEAARERDRKRVRSPRACPVCLDQYHPTGGKQKHCTRRCGVIARQGWPRSLVRFAYCKRCDQPFRLPRAGQAYCSLDCAARPTNGRLGEVAEVACKDCGQAFQWVVAFAAKPSYCDLCRKQRKREERRRRHQKHRSRRKHRQRARHYGVGYEPLDRQYVFERDRWHCKLCGKRVAKTKQAPHPKSPTIDCIVPLSVLGSPGYVLSNVQLACFLCNSVKHNRGGGEQLRLIG